MVKVLIYQGSTIDSAQVGLGHKEPAHSRGLAAIQVLTIRSLVWEEASMWTLLTIALLASLVFGLAAVGLNLGHDFRLTKKERTRLGN